MADEQLLALAYHTVLSGFVRNGRAPHYTDLAADLNLTADEALQLQRDLLDELGGPHWSDPGTDLIASFTPFSNIPTHYRISVGGQQKWYGQ